MRGALTWRRTSGDWRSGRYRIQLIAPGIWVLIDQGLDPSDPVPRMVTSSPSLKALKRLAARRERRRLRSRRLWRHSMILVSALAALGVAAFLPAPWMVIVTIALIAIALRSLSIAIDTFTQGSWTRLRQTYQ